MLVDDGGQKTNRARRMNKIASTSVGNATGASTSPHQALRQRHTGAGREGVRSRGLARRTRRQALGARRASSARRRHVRRRRRRRDQGARGGRRIDRHAVRIRARHPEAPGPVLRRRQRRVRSTLRSSSRSAISSRGAPRTIRNIFKVLGVFVRIVLARKLDPALTSNPVRLAMMDRLVRLPKPKDKPIVFLTCPT